MNGFSAGIPLIAEELTRRAAVWWESVTHPDWSAVGAELAAHKLWYTTWLGLFFCTYLMLRMLITRWGDTNVTRKALVLSLLLHTVGGLFTTSVHIVSHVGENSDNRDTIPLRNVIVEKPLKAGVSQSTPVPRRPGDRPVWDQLPTSPPLPTSRQSKPESNPGVDSTQPTRPTVPTVLPAARLPELNMPAPDSGSSLPLASQRAATAPVTPLLAAGTPAAPVDHAVSRPEATVGTTGPSRQSPTSPGFEKATELLPTRRGNPTEVASTLPDPTRDLLTPRSTTAPLPAIHRGINSEPLSRKATATPGQSAGVPGGDGPGGTPGVTQGDPRSTAVGQGKPSGSPFSRTPRSANSGSNATGDGNSGSSGSANNNAGSGEAPTLSRRTGSGGAGETGNLIATLPGGTSFGTSGGLPGFGTPGVVRAPGGPGGRLGAGMPGVGVPSTYQLRGPEQRKQSAVQNGASTESERSVELSLKWLANHQDPAGFWDANGFDVHCPAGDRCGGHARLGQDPAEGNRTPEEHQQAGLDADAGVTSLAILAFLGAGYKHEEGPYADNLDHALRWLIGQQGADGFLGGRANRYARMYCHGMATIALGEAYGMTQDESLREPLARAIQFTLDSQNPKDGGWRYVPGQVSDMSIFGWQLMGLKSAQTAGLTIPKEATDRCVKFLIDQGNFLKSRQLSTHGGLASYRKYFDKDGGEHVEPPRPSMTAESLFCKQILGIKRTNPAVEEAIEYLELNPPRRATEDLYYWYYGTLALYHHGGPSWRRWNTSVRELLVAEQRKDGHAAGSWDPRTPWGDFGGRVFSTAISTLTLEVYYRFLPMYRYDEKQK